MCQASGIPTRLTNRGHQEPINGLLGHTPDRKWNFEMLVFEEGGNRRTWQKTLGTGTKTNNKLKPHAVLTRDSNPGHIRGRCTTPPPPLNLKAIVTRLHAFSRD